MDDDSEKLGYRIRRAEMDKIPYVVVVGGREEEAGTVGVRKRLQGDLGAMPIAEFAARVQDETANKTR